MSKGNKKQAYETKVVQGLNLYLRNELKDPQLSLVSFTKCDLTDDFSRAKVYWDTFNPDSKKTIEEGFSRLRGKMRTYLARYLKVRHVPEVICLYDREFEETSKIEVLLAQEKINGKFFQEGTL
ncbi:MAG: 30S ribosome-binding factor RbfA [Halobacteriovoraceae bacterium]|nr:30S ribosome-binding factor RbfA [Halobacteriovoraceae bacterium]